VLSILRHEREAVLNCGRGDQGIEGPQFVGFRMALEQLVRVAGNAVIQIRLYGIRADEVVNFIGLPLIPCADMSSCAVIIEIVMSSKEST